MRARGFWKPALTAVAVALGSGWAGCVRVSDDEAREPGAAEQREVPPASSDDTPEGGIQPKQ